VQVSQSEGDLGCEKLGLVFREHANVNQMAEELATLDELHQEVDPELVLEDVLHVDKEGMVDLTQDVFLEIDVFHLLVFENNIFADAFHCVKSVRRLMLNQEYLTEGALPNHLSDNEVLKGSWL
jgi:hypothetical protein